MQGLLGSSDASQFHDSWSIQQVDEIAFERLTQDYPLKIAVIIFNALSRFAENERTIPGPQKAQGFDPEKHFGDNSDASWLPDFKSETNYREFEGILARRLHASAERIYQLGQVNEIALLDQLLRSNSWKLFQRLRWQLYADFPRLSAEGARKDVIDRIPFLNRYEFSHTHEFARLLQIHAKEFGEAFLSKEEVNLFFDVVITGPIQKSEDERFENAFRRKQLWPIFSLLTGDRLAAYKILCPDSAKISFSTYYPFRVSGEGARFIESVPPEAAKEFANMPDEDLWHLLNTWKADENDYQRRDWWVQEDYSALAKKFVEFVESEPRRFLPEFQWWRNINRPEPLLESLNRAIARIKENKTDNARNLDEQDWAIYFGIADWIVSHSSSNKTGDNANALATSNIKPDWYWPCIIVSNFLTALVQSEYSVARIYEKEVKRIFTTLIQQPDPRLQTRGISEYEDWLSIAINSIRGNAIEGIIALAAEQKKVLEHSDPWILNLLRSRLRSSDESPAIFAILGSKLRLLVYLFSENLEETTRSGFTSLIL